MSRILLLLILRLLLLILFEFHFGSNLRGNERLSGRRRAREALRSGFHPLLLKLGNSGDYQ